MIRQIAYCDECQKACDITNNLHHGSTMKVKSAMSLTFLFGRMKQAGWKIRKQGKGFYRIICPECVQS